MAREKHPDFHAKEIKDLLRRTMSEEVLIPFESKERAAGLRQMVYALTRAHRIHNTPEAEEFQHFRSRIHLTYDVITQREDYTPNYVRYPFTLLLDSRRPYTENLRLATSAEEISIYHEPKAKQPTASEPPITEDEEIDLTYSYEEIEDEQGEQLADLLSNLNGDDTS